MPLPPRRVAGRYLLQSLLGRGGAGAVWRAVDELLERDVAVKEVPFPAALPDAERDVLRARALREGRAAARLAVPGAVTVFDVVTEPDAAYLVMELVHAPTLGVLVTDEGPLDPARVARLGAQLLTTLEAAHAAGVVHRDVKPGNVLVRPGDRTALTDFGIATLADDPALTATGLLIGSPQFMAPEQAHGRPSTPQTDLWGLGATLYFAVEGVGPFDRPEALATLNAIAHEEPRPAQRAGELAPVLAGLLRKEPGERLSTEEAAAGLDAVARGEARWPEAAATQAPVRTVAIDDLERERGRVTIPHEAPVPARPPAFGGAASRGRSRRALPVLAAVGALALAAGLGYRAFGQQDGEVALSPASESPQAAQSEPSEVRLDPSPRAAAPPAPSAQPSPDPSEEVEPSEEPSPAAEQSEQASPPASDPSPDPVAIPADWVMYTDDDRGYTVAHPPGWEIVDRGDTITDFVDPAGGRYLRVDWTDEPPASAAGAWEDSSAAFAGSRADYVELGISPTEFRGYEAALWEYTYSEGGSALRASNLGIATGPYGYALNFQTRAADWEASQELYETLAAGFEFGPATP